MNLSKLFELQRQLDEQVEKEYPREEGENRLTKKILALQVKLGELCNCWQGFKYWSPKQEPDSLFVECPCGTDYGSCDEYGCSDGLLKYNPLIEKYVDCLQFLLSIGLELNYIFTPTAYWRSKDITSHFNDLFHTIALFYESVECDWWEEEKQEKFDNVIGGFVILGEMLSLEEEEIDKEYIKRTINRKTLNS